MAERVEITTGARLHFGIFSHAPSAGREFGGVGLMIDSPTFQLVAEKSYRNLVEADEDYRRRVQTFVERIRANVPELGAPTCRIRLARTIPAHCGLGSGTQLGMAVSQALSLLAGEDEHNPTVLARRVGRGARSAIGIHGFRQGGLLVDAGKAERGEIAPLSQRVEFPAAWRLLLVTPQDAAGLSGTREEGAFARLPGTPAATTGRLRQIVENDLLPAVTAADFGATGEALYEFGRLVGEYFAPVQGGVYAHPQMRRLAARLWERGIRGVGQTSWGPTLFVLVEDETAAVGLSEELAGDESCQGCSIRLAAPLNHGAVGKVWD